MIDLAALLRGDLGDADGGRAWFQRAIDSGNAEWAPGALVDLLNLLREQDDVDGARAAHRTAVDTGDPEAPYALVVIGQILEQRGDAQGAQAAFNGGRRLWV